MLKRFFDILTSTICIVLFMPVMLLEMVLIRMDAPGAVIFKQKRVGKNGKNFWI